MSSLITTRCILDALRMEQTGSQWEALFKKEAIDWERLAVTAIILGLAPQLYSRLTTWGVPVPARAMAKLAVTYQAQAKRNEAIYAQLDQMLAACRQHNLQPVALKGVHLATTYYPDPAWRPMNDIDLLFTVAELPAAEAILLELGYAGKYKSAAMGAGVRKHTSTFRRPEKNEGTTPNPYLSAAMDRTIEPHTSLEESWFGLSADITPGIRERTNEATLGNSVCRVLAPEDLLLHVGLHFCFHLIQGAPAMVQLMDLRFIIQAQPINWPLFQKRTVQYEVAPYALASLSLAQKLLSVPVPEELLTTLAAATPPRLRRYIYQADLVDIWRRTQQKPLTSIPQRIRRGFADRMETARWAPDWHRRWQVWRTLFQLNRSDTGQLLKQKLSGRKE